MMSMHEQIREFLKSTQPNVKPLTANSWPTGITPSVKKPVADASLIAPVFCKNCLRESVHAAMHHRRLCYDCNDGRDYKVLA